MVASERCWTRIPEGPASVSSGKIHKKKKKPHNRSGHHWLCGSWSLRVFGLKQPMPGLRCVCRLAVMPVEVKHWSLHLHQPRVAKRITNDAVCFTLPSLRALMQDSP